MRPSMHRRLSLSAQRGLSLVELMVGITVGLFVVAAAATLMANQLTDNRRLLLETQVQQDLRATMDIITRQLRRAGAAGPEEVEKGIATSPPVAGGASNPHGKIVTLADASAQTDFWFYFDDTQQGPYGFKLKDGVVQTNIPRITAAGSLWQDLTDGNAVVVTRFSVTPRVLSSAALPCPKLCPITPSDPTGQGCWPQVQVRNYVVEIEAHAKSDPSVRRALRNEVRIRNDLVRFNGPASPGLVCPV